MTTILTKIGTTLLLLAFSATTVLADTPSALIWLQSKQQTSGLIEGSVRSTDWATLAFGAAGMNPSTVGNPVLTSVLQTHPVASTTATELERRILALRAAGQSAATEVNQLTQLITAGQMGDPSLLNDDVFGILAFESVDISNSAIGQSVVFVQSHQNSDGGFSSLVGGSSDVDSTGSTVAALRSAGGDTAAIDRGFVYLAGQQNSDGGFGVKAGQSSNVASTSWALWAYYTTGRVNASAETWLRAAQKGDGSFGGAVETAYAVMALSGKALPVIGSFVSAPPSTTPAPSTRSTPASSTSSSTSSSVSGSAAAANASVSSSLDGSANTLNGSSASSSAQSSASTTVSPPAQLKTAIKSTQPVQSTATIDQETSTAELAGTSQSTGKIDAVAARATVSEINQDQRLVRNLILALLGIGIINLLLILFAIGQWFSARNFFRAD